MEQPPAVKKKTPIWFLVFAVVVMVVGAIAQPYAQAWVNSLSGIAAYIPFLVAAVVAAVCWAVFKILNKPKPHA